MLFPKLLALTTLVYSVASAEEVRVSDETSEPYRSHLSYFTLQPLGEAWNVYYPDAFDDSQLLRLLISMKYRHLRLFCSAAMHCTPVHSRRGVPREGSRSILRFPESAPSDVRSI